MRLEMALQAGWGLLNNKEAALGASAPVLQRDTRYADLPCWSQR